ncbi:MAG: carboxyl transferase [Lachnospiraceae bacterium]|nr:carboxyl transferase [Lachnospiraceae bacterium]
MSNQSKLSARDRINTLLDDNSFVEIGALVTKRNTDFNLQTKEAPCDGVITGYGTIGENPVYVYSQDASVLGGTIGEMHAKKIASVYDLAIKCGAPVIGLIDCAGLRLEEATDALDALGTVMYKQSLASGVVPQIAAVFGSCGGGLSVSASMNDFVFVEKTNGRFFVNTPDSVKDNNEGKCNTASADFKAECGAIDYVGETEEDVLNAVRDLIEILPSCNDDSSPLTDSEDDLNRQTPEFASTFCDPAVALADISDDGYFFEVKKEAGKDMVCGFIKLNGATIGCLANRTAILEDGKKKESFDGVLTAPGVRKAIRFVNFCDAFDIDILTLTNVGGFCNCMCGEKLLALASAKLTQSFANATVPKVNLITGKALGSAGIIMNSKSIGADLCFALEGAKIGTMEADLAAQIVYADDIKNGAKTADKAAEYEKLALTAESAAKRGYVDAVIDAASVRQNIIYAFEMLCMKNDDSIPAKKHGTV